MHKRTKKNPFGAGRKPLPSDDLLSHREICQLRPAEHKALVDAAAARGISRSNLLRSGLRAIGVQLGPDKKGKQIRKVDAA